MAYVPSSEDVRPRRRVRQPGWMEEYEGYALPQVASYTGHASAAREETNWSRERKGLAEMTPLTQLPTDYMVTPPSHIGTAPPVYVSTPQLYHGPPAMMDVLQRVQEDNRRLQPMVRDMKRQMDRSNAAPPSLQSALPHYPQDSHPQPAVRDSWPMPPLPSPSQAAPPHLPRVLHRLPVVQETTPDDDWPLPPPTSNITQ
ncbi:uncharacterized protein LOC115580317 [Scomber scombrus]|uniref:Uncharacterized protein LOC115580317 n=1 Tax=Scomber scombrus TaxID=13677 RepID=A0AAV1NI22_SCOSC